MTPPQTAIAAVLLNPNMPLQDAITGILLNPIWLPNTPLQDARASESKSQVPGKPVELSTKAREAVELGRWECVCLSFPTCT